MVDRTNEYLKAVKDGKVVAVGEKGTKKVSVNGLPANTDYAKGAIKIAFDKNSESKITDTTSDLLDDDAFKTLPISVTGVSLDHTTLALNTGQTGQLKATVAPSNASNKSVSYSSDNTAVATVDSSGKITAVKAGSAKITAKTADGAKTAVCNVTVTDPVVHVTGVDLDKTTLGLNVGASQQLNATIHPAEATDKTITWSSSDGTVATADNGKVIAKKVGTTTIKATTKDGNKVAECVVTVTNPVVNVTGVSLNMTSDSLTEGDTANLIATVAPSNASDKSVTWKSDNTDVATVDGTGKVTAVKAGTANITVTTKDGNKVATCKITVAAPKA